MNAKKEFRCSKSTTSPRLTAFLLTPPPPKINISELFQSQPSNLNSTLNAILH